MRRIDLTRLREFKTAVRSPGFQKFVSLGVSLGSLVVAIAAFHRTCEHEAVERNLTAETHLATARTLLSHYGETLVPPPEAKLSSDDLQRLTEAKGAAQQALTVKPRLAEAHWLIGLADLRERHFEQARQQFSSAIEISPQNPRYFGALGSALYSLGSVPEAEQAFRSAIDLDPRDSALQANLGLVLAKQERWDESAGAYQEAASLGSNDPGVLHNWGFCLEQAGKLHEALAIFRREAASDPTSASGPTGVANVLTTLGRTDEALRWYFRAIEVDAKFQPAYVNLALAEYYSGDSEAALGALRRGIDTNPTSIELRRRLGWMLGQLGRHEEATKVFQEAALASPDSSMDLRNLSLSLRREGKQRESLQELNDAVDLDPGNSALHNELGLAFWRVRRTEEAINQFRKAIEIDRKNRDAWLNLVSLLTSLSRTSDATARIDEALALFEADPDFLSSKARALLFSGDFSGGLAFAKRAVDLAPTSAFARETLGLAFFVTDQWRDAKAAFLRTIELEPERPTPYLNLSTILQAEGDKKAADSYLAHGAQALEHWSQTQ